MEVLETKFGRARIGKDGYYRITSVKEGNSGKLLHRLIFEDFYQCKLDEMFPEGVVIHHDDGNPSNNEIWNLVPMSREDHYRLHGRGAKGVNLSEEDRRKISISQNTTGFRNVTIQKKPTCKQGFRYMYRYYEDGKQKAITSVDIDKLKQKVLDRGLEWEEYSQNEEIKKEMIKNE